MNIYSIYKVVNILNGKIYIGFTSNYNYRKKSHKKSITNPKYKSIFHNALRKYGWNNFEWSIIFQSKNKNFCQSIMEPHFIQEYCSFGKNGYNMTRGGEGRLGYKHPENIKFLIGSRTRGKNLNEEHKQKIRNSHIGLKPSCETKLLMSKNRIGRKWYNNGIKNTQTKTHPGEGWINGRIKNIFSQ
jgi:group I intron endonuclease